MQVCQVCKRPLSEPHTVAIVPLYKSADHLTAVLNFVKSLDDEVPGGVDLFFVCDGSPDDSIERLRVIAARTTIRITLMDLSRNFGTVSALHAGMSAVSHCASVVFGSDLQEPEHLFVDFARRILDGSAEVCIGQRVSRDDPVTQRVFAGVYWWLNRNIFGSQSPKGGFDVFGLSRKAREALVALPELNSSLTSQLQWIGFNRVTIPYNRLARISGKSTWTVRRKIKLFADSIYGFSGIPIVGLFMVGLIGTFIFTVVGLLTFFGWIMGWMDVKGYPTIVLLIGFGQTLNLLAMGILGGYLYRTFDNSKSRPKYIVNSCEPLN